MDTRKKSVQLIAMLTVFAMIFTTMPFISGSYVLANEKSASISSIESIEVNAGDTVTVPVKISNNPGIMGMGLTVTYDENVLTPQKVETTSLTENGTTDDSIETAAAGRFEIIWADSAEMTGNGNIFNITFKASEYAAGQTAISFGYSKKDTFDEGFKDVQLNCTPATITINRKASTVTTIYSDSDQSVNDGDTIMIPIRIDNVDKKNSLSFDLIYDKSVFGVPISNADELGECAYTNRSDGIHFDVSGIDATVPSGTLTTIAFKVTEYSSGDYIFKFSSNDVAAQNFRVKVTNTHADENAIVYGNNCTATDNDLLAPIAIKNNHGIAGFRITVKYDPAVLKPVSVAKNSNLAGSFDNSISDTTNGSFDVVWFNSENYTGNGILFTPKFTVINGAAGTTKLQLSYTQADTCDEDGLDVKLEMADVNVSLGPEQTSVLESITAEKGKTAYNVNDELDVDDLTVVAHYKDESSKTVSNYTTNANAIDMTTAGDKTLMISYTENEKTVTTSVTLNVTAPLRSIKASKTLTEYFVGDTISLEDLIVTAFYSDDTSQEVTGYTTNVNNIDMSTVGEKTLTVSYQGKTSDITITVKQKPTPPDPDTPYVTSISATKTMTDYHVNDTLIISDLTVEAQYSDETKKMVTGFKTNVNDINMSTAGDKTLIISYTEGDRTVTTSIKIHVAAVLNSIKASKAITEYFVGDKIGLGDLIVTATYSDNTTTEISEYTTNVSAIDMSVAGEKTLTVSYGGKTSNVRITVRLRDPDQPVEYVAFVIQDEDAFVYSGKRKVPDLIIYNKNTYEDLIPGTDFNIAYHSDCKKIGIHKFTIKFEGNYASNDDWNGLYYIVPAKAAIKSTKAGKKKLTIKVKSQAGGVKYQIALKKKGSSKWKKYTSSKTSKTIKGLKSKNKYIVKIRAFKKVGLATYYGKWSKTKNIKIK